MDQHVDGGAPNTVVFNLQLDGGHPTTVFDNDVEGGVALPPPVQGAGFVGVGIGCGVGF